MPAIGSVGRISSLLILAFILKLALGSTSAVFALDLKTSLTYAEGLSGLLKRDNPKQIPVYLSDDSLITSQGHSNKISKAMRYLHSKAGDVVYKRNTLMRDQQVRDIGDTNNLHDHIAAQPDIRTDDQVISEACNDRKTRTCGYAVKTALKQRPEDKSRLALALRRKPEYVDASKLLYHKLFEGAIGKMEEKGIDSKLDTGLSLMMDRMPYGFVANKALNMAAKNL